MVSKLWYGLKYEIQQQLWLERLNPERSKYKTILQTAETIEMSFSVTKRFNSQGEKNDGDHSNSKSFKKKGKDKSHRHGNNGGSRSHKDQHRHHSPSRKSNMTPGFNSNEYRRNNGSSDSNQKRSDRKKPFHRTNLSKEEMERLRAENRCFGCKEVGHSYRQCSKRHQVSS